MSIEQESEVFSVLDVVARIEHYGRRVHMVSLDALHLYEIWNAFNGADEQRQTIGQSPAYLAAAVYEDAVFLKLVVILVRLLDQPKNTKILKSDRISFPVIYSLLSLPGVSEVFIARAPNSLGAILGEFEPNQSAEVVRNCIKGFGEKLHRLDNETLNRAKQLRNFRDVNFAHDLRRDKVEAKPLVQHVTEMVSEVMALMEDLQAIVNGSPSIYWPRGEAGESATQLWNAVAAAFPIPEQYL